MQTLDAPQTWLDEHYDILDDQHPETVDPHTGAVCGALGLLVLVLMLLIATGTVPLYEWPT